MPLLRANISAVLLVACPTPVAARGPSCDANCVTWALPLIATAGAACLLLAGLYYLAVAFVPRLRSWADARRGRAKNAATGALLALAGIAGLAIIVSVYVRL